MGIFNGISTELLFIHCSLIELEFTSIGFCEGRKTENPGKKPRSKNENQQQTQPAHIIMTPAGSYLL